ncbi:MAG TPA: TolC family protein [Candidatus Sulfotelmatobacter sp.]|jgi:cobalt-zinc-cadmium efflux system outer membrane protein|nr:TolC family protein [Candidatus Sulfotelmatobacter sp.]
MNRKTRCLLEKSFSVPNRKSFQITPLLTAMVLLLSTRALAQEQSMPGMQMPAAQNDMHHHHAAQMHDSDYPRFGQAQKEPGQRLFTLEDAQQIARAKNPTLRQAEAGIRAAKARQQQAGLLPNPVAAYSADEIRGGAEGGGKQGFFVEQRIVTGGKLARNRDVFAKETSLAEIEAEEQKIRVETAVKMAFYRVLAAQELADVRTQLARIANENATTEKRLNNTGQADDTEVLGAEIEAQRLQLAQRMQENTLREEWRSLSAAMGDPEMERMTVAGDLEHGWPELSDAEVLDAISKRSPAVRIADATAARNRADVIRAQREAIPDLRLRGGMEYNNELIGAIPRAIGWEGTAEVAVEIPIFNRNQGNVTAARAETDRAEEEKRRIALTLRERAATVLDQYSNARLMVEQYRKEILPRAKRAYTLMDERHGEMLASYPRVLETQRRLFELHTEYVAALESLWTNGIALQGFLLTDGLEAPARPGEMDRPVRETNVPMPERTMGPDTSSPRR